MSKRLQVLLADPEYQELQQIAKKNQMTVSEWVRVVLRQARRAETTTTPDRKLAVVRSAVRHEFPTADIDQMLAEIERGFSDEQIE